MKAIEKGHYSFVNYATSVNNQSPHCHSAVPDMLNPSRMRGLKEALCFELPGQYNVVSNSATGRQSVSSQDSQVKFFSRDYNFFNEASSIHFRCDKSD